MQGKKKILVVDDEAGILRFLKLKLEWAGYEVLTSTSGEEGLELMRTEDPDIALLDVLMVPVSGLEMLQKVREFSRKPVIMFTGHDRMMEISRGLGATDAISKPLDLDLLLEKISRGLEGPPPE